MSAVDRYVRHVERFGQESALEAAAAELTEAEYRRLLLRLGDGGTVECATPGCPVVFVPARKGQRYHSDACRQKAHRIRRGQEPGVDRRRGQRGSDAALDRERRKRVTNPVPSLGLSPIDGTTQPSRRGVAQRRRLACLSTISILCLSTISILDREALQIGRWRCNTR